MQNIEFKAELRDLATARKQCEVLGATFAGQLIQEDTYYRLADGRLKRRLTEGASPEWIYYHRINRAAPRMSNYIILTDDQARRRWGTQNLKPWLVVRKARELWMIEHVRIHLDEVEQLGCFVEFEAVVSSEHDVKECGEDVAELRDIFAPLLGETIGVSYSDMMAQEVEEQTN